MLYPIELWVRARNLTTLTGGSFRRGRAFYEERVRVTRGKFFLLDRPPVAVSLCLLELQQLFTASTVGELPDPPFPSQPWRRVNLPAMKKEDVYARMMHTPDDPTRAAQRAALREAWKQLLSLHRSLIDFSKANYAANVAEVNGPGHLLQLLQEDPYFAWLRPLTTLIVDLDSMARTDFEAADVAAIVTRLDRYFGKEPDPAFAVHYVPVLQTEFDVTTGHAAVRQAIAKLRTEG
jgi:hypothetical protein